MGVKIKRTSHLNVVSINHADISLAVCISFFILHFCVCTKCAALRPKFNHKLKILTTFSTTNQHLY